jgi:hypothetical protein
VTSGTGTGRTLAGYSFPTRGLLTILLDPGRLKWGVGPNRILGPPLDVGQRYTLEIAPGAIDAHGHPLRKGFSKPLGVSEAVRKTIAIWAWRLRSPAMGSREPLELTFPRPLDWAQLWHGIAVASETGRAVNGRIDVDMGERRWRFTPDASWPADAYNVRVSPTLEDMSGEHAERAIRRTIAVERRRGQRDGYSLDCLRGASGLTRASGCRCSAFGMQCPGFGAFRTVRLQT